MGEVINLNAENKKNSLWSYLVRGTPFEFPFFGGTVQMVGASYYGKKQWEFFKSYWPKFVDEIIDINRKYEFDSGDLTRKFKSLSRAEKNDVLLKCGEIYAFKDKLTYAEFIGVVDSYISKKDIKIEGTDFSGYDGAA